MERSPALQGISRHLPLLPTRPTMVGPRSFRVHAGAANWRRRPAYPQGHRSRGGWACKTAAPKRPESKLRYDLGPDRDHPDEQRDGGQLSRFFHENLEHDLAPLLVRTKN